jgi:hypothetical protein
VGLELQQALTTNLRRGASSSGNSSSAAAATRLSNRYGRNAGVIRFQPDGSFDESSLAGVGFHMLDATGARPASQRESTWIAQRLNGLSYEIPTNLPSFRR